MAKHFEEENFYYETLPNSWGCLYYSCGIPVVYVDMDGTAWKTCEYYSDITTAHIDKYFKVTRLTGQDYINRIAKMHELKPGPYDIGPSKITKVK